MALANVDISPLAEIKLSDEALAMGNRRLDPCTIKTGEAPRLQFYNRSLIGLYDARDDQ